MGGPWFFLVLGYLGDSLILGDCQGLGDRPEEKSPFPHRGGRGGELKMGRQMGIWLELGVMFGSGVAYCCYRYSHLLLHSEGSSDVETLFSVSQSSPGAGR